MEPVLQWVCVSYTKQSRGAPASTKRNALPVAFRLPAQGAPLVHRVSMNEGDDFEVHEELERTVGSRRAVDLRLVDARLRVAPPWTPGVPSRRRRPPAVYLQPGEWLRWHINYRISGCCTGTWFYHCDTLNLAHGPVAADTFLGQPIHLVDERAPLR